MKLNLNVDTHDRSQVDEVIQMLKCGDAYCLISHLDEQCRQYLKHGHKFESVDDVLEWVRNLINEDGLLDETNYR